MNTEPSSATVSAAAAKPSIRIRFAATDGSDRPARQSRLVTTIESSVQWMKKTTTYAVKSGE